MQYLGGKSRIAKRIAEEIDALSRREIKNFQVNSECYFPPNGGGKTAVS